MNVTNQVKSILKHSTKARNSDKELLVIYLQKSGMNLSDAQIKKFKQMPSLETVRRLRQKIQEEGHYRADDKVEQARFKKYLNMKQSTDSPKSIEDQLDDLGYRIVED